MLLLSTWAASSTLWQATLASLRASSCGSLLLLGLDRDSLTGPHVSSSAAMGYTCQCNQFLREERMSWIASLICCGLQGRGPGRPSQQVAPNSHLGYSFRKNLVSSLHSSSLNDSPISIACSLAVWDLCILSP